MSSVSFQKSTLVFFQNLQLWSVFKSQKGQEMSKKGARDAQFLSLPQELQIEVFNHFVIHSDEESVPESALRLKNSLILRLVSTGLARAYLVVTSTGAFCNYMKKRAEMRHSDTDSSRELIRLCQKFSDENLTVLFRSMALQNGKAAFAGLKTIVQMTKETEGNVETSEVANE